MQVNIAPDLEALIEKRLSSGSFADAEEVIRRALESQDLEESSLDDQRNEIAARIDRSLAQAERGELLSSAQVRTNLDAAKREWRATTRGN